MMTDVNTAVLATQEAAIASGSKMLRPGVSDRVVRLLEAIRAYGPPRVALERAVYLTESLRNDYWPVHASCWGAVRPEAQPGGEPNAGWAERLRETGSARV
jgi:hypothetical protein